MRLLLASHQAARARLEAEQAERLVRTDRRLEKLVREHHIQVEAEKRHSVCWHCSSSKTDDMVFCASEERCLGGLHLHCAAAAGEQQRVVPGAWHCPLCAPCDDGTAAARQRCLARIQVPACLC